MWLRLSIRVLLGAITGIIAINPLSAIQVQDWGHVTDQEWEIESFPEDENAHSIILFDAGESYIDKNLSVIFSRHTRVKILDPEQSDFTDISLSVHEDRQVQNLRKIKAQTLNLTPDGSVSANGVHRREFYREDTDEIETTSFTFPAVEPGSIVEYEYEIKYGSLLGMPGWTFQDSSPTLHSEYTVMVPDFLNYRSFTYGYEAYKPVDEKHEIYNRMSRNMMAAKGEKDNNIYRTVLKNAPAVRSEPHISSLHNYKNRVRYQLTGYRDNRNIYNSYMSTWDEIAEELMDSWSFGKAISSRRSVRRVAKEVTKDADTDLGKAKALYRYVASDIQWNEKFRLLTSDRAHKIIDDLSGNSSDKAVTLISLLREAGLKADPVLVSTRQHGWVDWSYPELSAFNHVQVLLTLDDSLYLLEPLEEIIPFGLQLPSSNNGSRLLVHDESAEIVEQTQIVESSSRTNALLELNPDGSVQSTVRTTFQGYDAIINRTMADKMEDEKEYLGSTLLSGLPDPEITNTSLVNLEEPEEPFSVDVEMTIPGYASVAGDMIYLNPFLVERLESSPFTSSVRNFPVEFSYGTRSQYNAMIKIPADYEILEVPENKTVKFSDKTAYQFISGQEGNTIQLIVIQLNSDSEIEADLYDDLRQYYASLVDTYSQQIVLRKKSDAMEMPAGNGGSDNQDN